VGGLYWEKGSCREYVKLVQGAEKREKKNQSGKESLTKGDREEGTGGDFVSTKTASNGDIQPTEHSSFGSYLLKRK